MKRAIVTGGAGLIGQGIIARLQEDGWEVASLDLQPSRLGRHIDCDLGDEASITAAMDTLGWDRLDLLVNNGGKVKGGTSMDLAGTSLADWNALLDTHLTGAFLMSRAALPLLANGGSIVMMVSTRALMSEGGDFAYAAAKGGMVGLTQALAVQLGPRIRVNAIAPGWITDATDLSDKDHAQHPVGRVGRPADIAQAVLYLAQADFVTGQCLVVDGGMTKKMIYAE
ncbi:SDR family NAD(P)-dependent oxidoreductase [Falsirhodobacter sp. 20TX0035]|uniref:SDR family NAD(P)-dependent oxidoreductase n=1 Tax=Falsirhodobacter sp. 20TX0035 TaxID=3022019 RepID=UPI002330D58F|nr:SDR family oxidoreductase [Falsirhodobacter sp. 20TX0035]MDB6452779.1 SDR family oxidoreductase [Falsirhodobacter sp. 20TX0035]